LPNALGFSVLKMSPQYRSQGIQRRNPHTRKILFSTVQPVRAAKRGFSVDNIGNCCMCLFKDSNSVHDVLGSFFHIKTTGQYARKTELSTLVHTRLCGSGKMLMRLRHWLQLWFCYVMINSRLFNLQVVNAFNHYCCDNIKNIQASNRWSGAPNMYWPHV
jgi:hypothetical protein